MCFIVSVRFRIIASGSNGNSVVFSNEDNLKRSTHFENDPPILTMTEIFRLHGLEKIDFLKIDIEGSEFDLFINNNEWLKNVDKIAMEVHQEFQYLQ